MVFASGVLVGSLFCFLLFFFSPGKKKDTFEAKADVAVENVVINDSGSYSDERLRALVSEFKDEQVGKLKELYEMSKGNVANARIVDKIDNVDYDEAIFN